MSRTGYVNGHRVDVDGLQGKTLLHGPGRHPGRYFGDPGQGVLTADNARQALAMYEARRDEIALVLTDMVMPEMDGLQLFHALKTLHPAVKVVMMTGYPLGEESQRFLAQGIIDWLQKPLKIPILAQTIRRALAA